MELLKDINALKIWRSRYQNVGLVPTMGALHAGHMSLVSLAQENSDHVLVSIFVNPTQFDKTEDLEKYPNKLEEDLEQLNKAGVSAVFLPDFDQLYPDAYRYQITEIEFSKILCGEHRNGHFDGVLTVVMKLFNLVKPKQAYFGEKDFQQLSLIKDMVQAFFLEIQIVAAPIIRETDGLAMSSRNTRLTATERKIAPQLYATLKSNLALHKKHQHLTDIGFDVDYLEVMNDRLLCAASLGDVRLIDNIPYGSSGDSA